MIRFSNARLATIPLWALFALVPQPALAEEAETPHESMPENFLQVAADLYSGGEPRGTAMFEALARRGIRTAISVDGLAPDVDTARRFGIEYIHIPIGYDCIQPEAAAAIAKVLQDKPGPFYIHCHHGKHRGPAMAAIALRLETGCTDDVVEEWLTRAGVGEAYRGLWHDALAFESADIDGLSVELREKTEVSDMAGAMVELGRVWERLKTCAAANWEVPTDQAEVSPAHEALMLDEHFRELVRAADAASEVDGVTRGLREAAVESRRLRDALQDSDLPTASESYEALQKSCKNCHRAWRN